MSQESYWNGNGELRSPELEPWLQAWCILWGNGKSASAYTPTEMIPQTFWEEAGSRILQMLSKVPAISEVIISFNELYSVASSETQLIRASG